MTIKHLAEQAKWNLDQIGISSPAQLAMLEQPAYLIYENLFLPGKISDITLEQPIGIPIIIHWAPAADVVLWLTPPPSFYQHGILFSSYDDFRLWLIWKIQARRIYTKEETKDL